MRRKTNRERYFDNQFTERGFFSPSAINFVIYSQRIWKLVSKLVKESQRIIDLGCGGGTVLYNLAKLTRAKLVGVDFSQESLRFTKMKAPASELFLADVSATKLKKGGFDFCVSTMVVEHVENDTVFLKEVYRLLKTGGYLLISTVVKKKWAWYFYKNQIKERVLEPTHVREYASAGIFEALLEKSGFEIILSERSPVRFPLIDPVIKRFFRFGGLQVKSFLEGRLMETIRLILRIPVPGYSALEIVARKKEK